MASVLQSRHIPISKMVRSNFVRYLRPKKSLKLVKCESLIFEAFCSFFMKTHHNSYKSLKMDKNHFNDFSGLR